MEDNSNKVSTPTTMLSSKKFNLEIASELGMDNFDSLDSENLQSKENRFTGGYMTKGSLNSKEELKNK